MWSSNQASKSKIRLRANNFNENFLQCDNHIGMLYRIREIIEHYDKTT